MKTLTCLLLLSLFSFSCQRQIDFGNNPPGKTISAVYTLSKSINGDCIVATVNGNYAAGIPLSSNNTVIVQVDVTIAGSYNISTAMVNGYKFTASGKFSSTGIQYVILAGEGTPLVAEADIFSTGTESADCTFNISIGVPGPAVYLLAGAPNACVGITVSGTYVTGIPLAVNNNVTVRVNVTSIGNYTISTNTIDGITFSKSGSFTSTGVQNIILPGSGTPLATGAKIFTIGSGGCTFAVTVAGGATYTFSGSPGNCTVATIMGTYKISAPLTSSNIVIVQVNVSVIGFYTISTNTTGGMTFSASGVFYSTGLQLVSLNGAGTPTVQGLNVFKPGINGCLFSIPVS